MQDLLRHISTGYIFDIIPLDLFLHCIIGGIITIYSLMKGLNHWTIFLILLAIAGLKEVNDYSFHQFAGWKEYIEDFVVTFTYFLLSFFVKRTKAYVSRPSKYKKIKIKM